MVGKLKNIIEDISLDFLDKALEKRTDICTCPVCVNDMLAHVLSHVPAQYVTSDEAAMNSIIEQTKVEKEAEIARAVLGAITIIGRKPRHPAKDDKTKSFQLLLDKILEDRGLDFRHYHKDILQRRVSIRMRANNVDSFSDYLMVLIKNPKEYDKLFEVLCINVSEFFRDPEVWPVIKDTLQKIIEHKTRTNDLSLTIWSSACASGEEPYSIAILLNDNFKNELKNFEVNIIATDIDPKALRAAQKAEYQKTFLKNLSAFQLKTYFSQTLTGNYLLKDEIKRQVAFKSLDLISSDFIRNTDLVFCRNVFIYFTRSLQDQLLMKYYHSLRVGGFLVMGKTETMWNEARHIFEEINLDARIYRKKIATS